MHARMVTRAKEHEHISSRNSIACRSENALTTKSLFSRSKLFTIKSASKSSNLLNLIPLLKSSIRHLCSCFLALQNASQARFCFSVLLQQHQGLNITPLNVCSAFSFTQFKSRRLIIRPTSSNRILKSYAFNP